MTAKGWITYSTTYTSTHRKQQHVTVKIRDLRIGNFRSNQISNWRLRFEFESNQGVIVYMFNADCHVGVVYLIMCKPTTLLHATLYVLFVVRTVGLQVAVWCSGNALILINAVALHRARLVLG